MGNKLTDNHVMVGIFYYVNSKDQIDMNKIMVLVKESEFLLVYLTAIFLKFTQWNKRDQGNNFISETFPRPYKYENNIMHIRNAYVIND